MSVDTGYVNGDYFYMNSSTRSIIRNQNSIDYKNDRYEISTNKYWRLYNGSPDGGYIDDILPASAPNKYFNMEYNIKHHNLQSNGNILTPNNSPVTTVTSTSVKSTNEEGCSLFSPIHKKIKYLDQS